MANESVLSKRFSLRRSRLRLRDLRRDRRGVTAVEFAIIAPVLIAMFMALVDFGLGLYTQVQVADAAQSGAAYAMQKGYNSAAMITVAKASTPLTGLTVTPSTFCGCPSDSGVTTTACSNNCGDGLAAGTFAQVNVTKAYSTLLSYPGLPSTINISETTVARIQ